MAGVLKGPGSLSQEERRKSKERWLPVTPTSTCPTSPSHHRPPLRPASPCTSAASPLMPPRACSWPCWVGACPLASWASSPVWLTRLPTYPRWSCSDFDASSTSPLPCCLNCMVSHRWDLQMSGARPASMPCSESSASDAPTVRFRWCPLATLPPSTKVLPPSALLSLPFAFRTSVSVATTGVLVGQHPGTHHRCGTWARDTAKGDHGLLYHSGLRARFPGWPGPVARLSLLPTDSGLPVWLGEAGGLRAGPLCAADLCAAQRSSELELCVDSGDLCPGLLCVPELCGRQGPSHPSVRRPAL
ncbi:uncharacterized protein LOC102506816 [Camelus ferus]|uniref:Uncharacterized protein LOC102506816 n=1 Tax=Camelus ferus TaxID=419612 RepID=A0A8B7KB85_CAMFR|nr:uncharacterized protein LOC102506816 [Camelus ferus]